MSTMRRCLFSVWAFLASIAAVANPAPVAEVAGSPITASDFDSRAQRVLAPQEDAFRRQVAQLNVAHARNVQAAREAELKRMVEERLVDLEARANHTDAVTVLARINPVPPTDADVQNFYDERKARINRPLEEVAGQIRAELERQARERASADFYADLERKYPVKLELEPLRESVATDGPSRGPTDAPVTIVEFADFQCPYCARIAPTLRAVLEHYPKDVRLVFRHLPIPQLHPDAERLSDGAICADEQHRFWEFYDVAFSQSGRFDTARLMLLARDAGLDVPTYESCLESDRPTTVLKREVEAGDALALTGTPALFINGRLLQGAVPIEQISAVIDDELRRLARAPAAR